MTDCIQVVTTAERREDAERIARTLVEERLAACVQVLGPITSTYWWGGKIETTQEWQCWAKSRLNLYGQIEQAIRRIHPYDVPEILALPILEGSPDYLAWLDGEVKGAEDRLTPR
jgi:periplasmic divalent cation tolerance protein